MRTTSPNSPMQGYDVRPLELDAPGIAACASLLGAVLTPALNPAYLNWLYTQNPMGAAVGFNAYAGDQLVAHYATMPMEAQVDGRGERGILSLNTATHPAHQGKGLFTQLAERTYERAAERGAGFVVGVGNAKSTHGLTNRLGFQFVAPLDVDVGIAGMAGMGAAPRARDGAQYGFRVHWSDAATAWRLARPGARYFAGNADGESREVLARVGVPGLLATLAAVPAALAAPLPRHSALEPFRLHIGLDRSTRRSGVFVPVPEWLKRSPLNLTFRDLRPSRRTLDVDAVRFSLMDFDAY